LKIKNSKGFCTFSSFSKKKSKNKREKENPQRFYMFHHFSKKKKRRQKSMFFFKFSPISNLSELRIPDSSLSGRDM